VPQLLVFDEFASKLRVACTQPRGLAATSLARRVSEEIGVVLREEVGYHIGSDKTMGANGKHTRLTYMTEGVLLRQLAHDKDLSQYACIIIDEVHERVIGSLIHLL
jgi:HrpA-like RNA helicase